MVPGIAGSLFLEDQEKPTPIDGLAFYAQAVFKTIREQKELNLPAQRLMVAAHRCHEISKEVLEQAAPAIEVFKNECKSKVVEDFKTTCESIYEKVLS